MVTPRDAPCDSRGVNPAVADRALSLFDAFLRHARAGAARAAPVAPSPLTVVRPEPDENTRVAAMPARSPMESTWDDPTGEKAVPTVMQPAPLEPATDVSVRLPSEQHAHAMEQSIIIDDDSLTQPEMPREAATAAPLPAAGYPAVSELDTLLLEAAVLVKYSHTPSAAQALEHWSLTHPDDLQGQLRVAEFEMARVDREVALRRYGTLVSLFLDRGDLRSAGDVMRRLRRDLPGDARVTAIAQWNGLDA